MNTLKSSKYCSEEPKIAKYHMKCYPEDEDKRWRWSCEGNRWRCSHPDTVILTITFTYSVSLYLKLTFTPDLDIHTFKVVFHVIFCHFELFKTIFGEFKGVHWIELVEMHLKKSCSKLENASGPNPSVENSNPDLRYPTYNTDVRCSVIPTWRTFTDNRFNNSFFKSIV